MAAADEDDIHDLSSEDEDYSYEDEVSDNDTTLPGNISGKRGQSSKRKSCKGVVWYSSSCDIKLCICILHIFPMQHH
jgi:hypothetical protein